MIALLAAAGLLAGARLAPSSRVAPVPPDDRAIVRAVQDIYNGRANQLRVRPPRLEEVGVAIDGRLDEPQWARAALLTGFSQFSPSDGTAAEDSTEVLVWYSPTAIHFGIRAYESHGTPRATLADRDKITADDHVQILLSTFNDGRQATVFAVNPFGVQADGTLIESNTNISNGFGGGDRKSTRLNSSHPVLSRMPSSA